MKILFDKKIEDNKYMAQADTEFTDQENELVKKFGDPMVNVGGSIPGTVPYTLPDEFRNLKAGFAYTRTIDGSGDPDAEDKANQWVAEMSVRFTSAINALRAKADGFTGQTVETV